jgi:hypothetical protein
MAFPVCMNVFRAVDIPVFFITVNTFKIRRKIRHVFSINWYIARWQLIHVERQPIQPSKKTENMPVFYVNKFAITTQFFIN